MALPTKVAMRLLLALVACDGGEAEPPWSEHSRATAETGGPVHSATEFGHTGALCDAAPGETTLAPTIRLFPEDEWDWAGRDLDVADIDNDCQDDVVVSSDWTAAPYAGYGNYEPSAVYLLKGPVRGDALVDAAFVSWKPNERSVAVGHKPLLLPAVQQVGMGGKLIDVDSAFLLFDVPATRPGSSMDAENYHGFIDEHAQEELGVAAFSSRCRTPRGPALCLSGTNPDGGFTFPGHVLVYELPLVGARPVLGATAWLKGDPGDDARVISGDGDLDADGRPDLVIGAYGWSDDVGRLAVVLDMPEGDHRLWDVAAATVTGEVAGEEFGLGLSTADVNGDGTDDVLAGSPLGDGGAFVFFGPFSGDRPASAADVEIGGGRPSEWLGCAVAAADLTSDGGADLAVGAPWSTYVDQGPGSVLVFDDPRGALDASAATWRLRSGVASEDAFGIAVKAGDLDGDGFGDLVVGAPRDPTIGTDAGSVTIFSGASL